MVNGSIISCEFHILLCRCKMYRLLIELCLVLILSTLVLANTPYPTVRNVTDFKQYADDTNQYRLPKNVVPISYNVFIFTTVHLKHTNFTGEVEIAVDVREPTTRIILQQRQLDIESIQLAYTATPQNKIDIDKETYDNITEFLTIPIRSGTPISAGSKLTLTIKYSGNLRTDRAGFYVSLYKEDQNEVYVKL